jgi:hypothetical protein
MFWPTIATVIIVGLIAVVVLIRWLERRDHRKALSR